ncbi:hypothetical protein [uncultured Methylobacterium sp.]|uniref:hypothetical protein n=1 Tax=uncultured Methylobacterium sp. TaxID=157278 RepID=UPI0035CA7651
MRRRHVFFIPGYDPEGRTRCRLLFLRERVRYAKRFDESHRPIAPGHERGRPSTPACP